MGATSSTVAEESKLQAEDFVNKEIQDNRVILFSKSTCPYCRMAKKALSGKICSTAIAVYKSLNINFL